SCKRFFVVSLLRMTSLFLVLRYFIVSNEYFGFMKLLKNCNSERSEESSCFDFEGIRFFAAPGMTENSELFRSFFYIIKFSAYLSKNVLI
ncbi:MAG: hypothetical protein M1419_08990, partial [Bacteroidetes bacterium]|nr:hypothetical protein [Bacteroidota bacterium]